MERAPVGVLFVHGIGEQRTGATLLQCADPLVEWVQRWTGVDDAALVVHDTRITEPAHGDPAHLRMRVQGRDWVIAESRWASTFRAPTYDAMIGWSVATGTRVLLRFGRRRIRDSWSSARTLEHDRSARRWPGRLVARWRTWRAARAPGAGAGTRAAATAAESTTDAIVDELAAEGSATVTSDLLGRLAGGVATLGIVSTWIVAVPLALLLVTAIAVGVAVAVLPLLLLGLVVGAWWKPTKAFARHAQAGVAANLGDAYVFTTSRLSRAAMVTQVRADLAWLRDRAERLVVVAHSQGTVIAYLALHELPESAAGVELFVTCGSAFDLLGRAGALPRSAWDLPAVVRPNPDGSTTAVRWLDLWSSADPVPDGPLPDGPGRRSVRLYNQASILTDHSGYWTNAEQFVAPLALAVAELAGTPLDTDGDRPGLVRAARERSLRHLTRVLARLGWLAAAAVATAASWFDLGGVVRPAATWLAGHLDLLPDAVADRVRDLLAADTTQRMLGAGALAALAAAAYRATAVPVGRAWDRRACERQAARRPTLRSLDLVPLAATVALAWVGAVAAAVHRGGTWPAWALGAGIWCIALLALPLSIDRMERAALTGPRTARGRSRRGP